MGGWVGKTYLQHQGALELRGPGGGPAPVTVHPHLGPVVVA